MTRTLVGLSILLLACTHADEARRPPPTPPPPAPAFAPRPTTPPPPPAPHGRRHGVPRAQLGTSDTLPTHGIVVHTYGIGGESIITIDRDAKTLHSWSTSMDESKPRDRTRTLTADALAKLVEVADAAWAEDPTGPMAQATDIREDLYVVDGDDGFYLSGYPIHAFGAPTGRPAASRAIEAIYGAAH
jgi:hypothetical protein